MNKYRMGEPIGTGSFGKVFRGVNETSGKAVAIKCIPKYPKEEGRSQEDTAAAAEAAIMREVEIWRDLDHENIVRLQASFQTETEVCLVTELAGGDLWNVLSKEKKLKEGRIWYVARAMLEALDHMHEQGKVHMDVKLENVLVFDEAWVKLCDFGLSRRLPPQAAHRLVAIACHPGTPMYMAPEMIFKRPYNFKIDVYSLGIMLYKLANGEAPCESNDEEVLRDFLTSSDDIQYPKEMSQQLRHFLQRCLERDPSKRPSCRELLSDPFIGLANTHTDPTEDPLASHPTPSKAAPSAGRQPDACEASNTAPLGSVGSEATEVTSEEEDEEGSLTLGESAAKAAADAHNQLRIAQQLAEVAQNKAAAAQEASKAAKEATAAAERAARIAQEAATLSSDAAAGAKQSARLARKLAEEIRQEEERQQASEAMLRAREAYLIAQEAALQNREAAIHTRELAAQKGEGKLQRTKADPRRKGSSADLGAVGNPASSAPGLQRGQSPPYKSCDVRPAETTTAAPSATITAQEDLDESATREPCNAASRWPALVPSGSPERYGAQNSPPIEAKTAMQDLGTPPSLPPKSRKEAGKQSLPYKRPSSEGLRHAPHSSQRAPPRVSDLHTRAKRKRCLQIGSDLASKQDGMPKRMRLSLPLRVDQL